MKLYVRAMTVLVLTVAATALPTFPNIGYLGDGYDLLFGNPHNTDPRNSPDPGFRAPIFNLTLYDRGGPTPDNRYQVPMGVSVDICSACQVQFSSVLSTGTSSFASSLQEDVSFSIKGWDAAFKASVDFKQVEKRTQNHSSVVLETAAICCVYTASLATYAGAAPPFTADFSSAIDSMPTEYDPTSAANLNWFSNFFMHFGTSFPTRVAMGGRFGVRYSIDSHAFSVLSSSNINVNVAASYSALSFSAAASSMTDVGKSQADYFNSQTTTSVTFNVGGTLPASGKYQDWIPLVQEQPMPIHLQLSSLDQLLNPMLFPQIDGKMLAAKQAALVEALTNYCLNVVAQGALVDCNPPLPDVPPPPPSIFGGTYQVDPCGADQKVNPYTNGLSCPAGFTYTSIAQVMTPLKKCAAQIYLCLRSTAGGVDPLGYFGGMYQKDDLDAGGRPNPLTGHMSCPAGFSSHRVGRVLSTDYKQGTAVNMCLNLDVDYTRNPIGGAYQQGDLSPKATVVNPITGAASCPPKYTPYRIARIVAPEPSGYLWGATMFLCLNNVVPL